jgi:hypothetical protein
MVATSPAEARGDSRPGGDPGEGARDAGGEPPIELEEDIREMVVWGWRSVDPLRTGPADYVRRA